MKTSTKLLLMVAMLFSAIPLHAQNEPTLTFTAQTTTGAGSVVPVLTWSTTPAATSCTASGDATWTGTKAASGTQTLASISASKTYQLSCTWPGDTSATLTWTPPTQNTDGTALTNLAGYKVYRAATSAGVASATPTTVAGNVTTHRFSSLAAGANFFGVTAYNSAGAESGMSNIASKTVSATETQNRSVAITVNPKPNAPTGLTVE